MRRKRETSTPAFRAGDNDPVTRRTAMEAVERHFTTAQVVRRGEVDAQLLPGRRIHAQLIGKFPDAETNLLRIGTDSVLLDRQLQRIEFLRPVAVGPPQAGLLNPQGRALGRRAVHRAGLPGSEIDRQRETDTAVQSARAAPPGMVRQRGS